MAKARSPGYPIISLKEAIEKIEQVYKRDYQNKVPRIVVAQHMGYQGLNGKSLGVLSSVSKYGLLEGRGDENWVSELALQIIAHEQGSPEWAEAVTQAAAMPDLFVDLKGRFPAGGSDAAVRSYLLTRKFLPAAVDIAIRAYRETMQLVSSASSAYHTQVIENDTQPGPPPVKTQVIEKPINLQVAQTSPARAELGEEYLRHRLSPDCEVRLYVTGKISTAELKKLRQLIYMSELWGAEADADKPKGHKAVEDAVDEASKP